jgi:hypothetical protein
MSNCMYTAQGDIACNEDSNKDTNKIACKEDTNKDTIEHFGYYSTPYYYAYYAPYNPRAPSSSYGTYDAGYHVRYGLH